MPSVLVGPKPWGSAGGASRSAGRALFALALILTAFAFCATPVFASGGPTGGAGLGSPTSSKPKPKPKPKARKPTKRVTRPVRKEPEPPAKPKPVADPFGGRGMWIWYVSASSGGNVSSIVAQAKAYGISTLMIKSGDGTSMWSQFNPTLVSALHAAGLRVCAWQYVYGNHPQLEAQVGAAGGQRTAPTAC